VALTGDVGFSEAELLTLLKNIDRLTHDEAEEVEAMVSDLQARSARQAAYDDLIAFCKYMQPDYKVGRHHRILADQLMALDNGAKDRVAVNLPPRHGKSQLVSIYYPAWYIGRNPGKKVMMVSHTTDLAVDFGRKVRNLMNDTRYQEIFAGITLAQDSKSAGRWSTNHGSEYYATGVGSSLAGRGADMLIIDDPHALEINTPIPTPNGFVAIQDLKEGDFVFGPDGEPVKVLAKSEVWHDRELYSVTTDDGEEVLCDAQHLWGVNSDTNLGKAKVYNFTAEYLSNWPKANRPVIPRHQPVQYPARSLPIDPWVLGAWLGDGTTSGGRMTACPADQPYMLAEFAKAGYKASPLTKDGFTFTAYGLMPQLRTLGVLNNKHIPEEYMVASTEQRMALLQGLIDTDGSVAASGQAGFYNCNLRLVTQVKELLHSLGVKCAVRTYLDTRGRHATSQPNHRVMFRLADCARMPRKLKYTRTPTDKRSRSIEVENTGGRGSVQCITVDRADGLFLAGRGYVVTHNSEQDVLAGNFEVFDKAYQWFTFGARTRLMPGGCVALVQTRWHLQDLTGRVVQDMTQNENADQYEVVEFPAIMEIKQPDGTTKERALWPAFFDLAALRRTQASMPTFQWNAQYQQDPTAEGSALIKRDWWRIWTETEPPEADYVIMALDAAAEQKEQADYTAITTWGVFFREEDRTNNLILLDAVRRRVEYPELRVLAKEMYDRWEPDAFIVEKKSSGVALFQELRRTGMMLQEFTPHRGTGNKFARMQAVADIVKAGIVWVPTTRWAEELVEEIASFPVGAHDDLADTAVMALTRFRQGGFIRLPTDEEEDEAEYVPKRAAYY